MNKTKIQWTERTWNPITGCSKYSEGCRHCYAETNVFYEWMKDKKHRDIVVPEERCIVVMKPKRYDHHYSGDWLENQRLNEWNHHSFLVIRDGENVMCIESDNLCIYDKVFFKVLVEYKEEERWWEKERKEQEANPA